MGKVRSIAERRKELERKLDELKAKEEIAAAKKKLADLRAKK